MNKIPLYQHPFVDVFKAFKLSEWKNSEKSGEVTETIDKTIGKKVLQLVGPSNTATFIQIPKAKSSLKSLGLIGKYVYIEAIGSGTKPFSMHFDYIIDDKQTTRISFSNLFKVTKVANTTNLQVPLQIPETWSIICIHVVKLLEMYKVFLPGSKKDISMRSLQICGNVTLKGIYTSDIQYTIRTLSKEMAFKQPKDVDWYSLYQWIDVPQMEGSEETKKQVVSKGKENEKKLSNQKTMKVLPEEPKVAKPLPEEPKAPPEPVNEPSEDLFAIPQTGYPESVEPEPSEEEPLPYEMPAKGVKTGPTGSFRLKPDPLFRLRKLLGISHRTCPTVEFNKNAKRSDEFTFACGSVLVHMNCDSSTQRFSFSAHNGDLPSITKLNSSKTNLLTVDDKEAVTVWDNNLDNSQIITFTPPLAKVAALAVSKEEKFLAIAGKDMYKRDMIIVYNLTALSKSKKVEIEAKQLSDFEVTHIEWSPEDENSFVTCGYESVRFWKTKNGTIPGKTAIFQQPLRGKKFIGIDYIKGETGNYSHILAATECGMIFKVKVANRTVEQIIKGTESVSLFRTFNGATFEGVVCPFWATASGNKFRLWDSTRNLQLLEHTMEESILNFSFNLYGDKIAILDSSGNVGVLKLKLKTYETLVRSHTDSVIDFDLSGPSNSLVTGSKDGTIRVWSLTEFAQTSEFLVSQDQLTALTCSPTEPLCVCGFTSGFIRVFDLATSQLYTCPGTSAKVSDDLRGVCYSKDGYTLAVVDSKGRITLVDARERRYEVFKAIQSESMNPNYLDMGFSVNGELFAHIGNNANTVCVWETTNYSLKYQLDLPGEIISKIQFAPNAKDLLVLTATSKLKYFRVDPINQRCYQVMEVPGLHDLECTGFCISENCAFVITSGKDCIIKAFDYAMRGDLFPAFQAFLGHQSFPSKLLLSPTNNLLVSISKENNFVYVWDSYVTSHMVDIPRDIMEITKASAPERVEEAETLVPAKAPPKAHPHPVSEAKLWIPPEEPQEFEGTLREVPYEIAEVQPEELVLSNKRIKPEYVVGYNGNGLENIVWEKTKWLAYTSTNKLLVEVLENVTPESRKQFFLSFGADKVDSVIVSPNKKLLAVYSRYSMYAGSTAVYVIDTHSWKVLSHITIPHPSICTAEFSPNNNILMVLSGTESESTLHFYDPLASELLLRSALPRAVTGAKWNPFSSSGLEFVVMDAKKYEFWLLTPELNLQYQEGKLFAENAPLSTFGFSEPILALATILLIIAKENGSVDLVDTRTNSPVVSGQLAAQSIKLVQWRQQRLVFATSYDNVVYSVPIDSQEYF